MSPRPYHIRFALGALSLALIVTSFLAFHFNPAPPQTDALFSNLPSLLIYPLVALPLFPSLLAP